MLSEQASGHLRDAIMRGQYAPGEALEPQDLAKERGVSLAVVREALVRLVGDGLADRLPNRGFAVPAVSDRRWQEVAEARRTVEPLVLRLSLERGDLEWEARVRATHHRLARTPAFTPGESRHYSGEWAEAHRIFHRTLLEGRQPGAPGDVRPAVDGERAGPPLVGPPHARPRPPRRARAAGADGIGA